MKTGENHYIYKNLFTGAVLMDLGIKAFDCIPHDLGILIIAKLHAAYGLSFNLVTFLNLST